VRIVPSILYGLSTIGTAAMLWVGGGILVHGLEELNVLTFIPHTIHDVAHAIGRATGPLSGIVNWIVNAIGGAIVGLLVGGIIVAVVRRFTKRPEELIVD